MNAKFYVPFDTAKLLKKAGYPQSDSDMYYTHNGELKSQADIYADCTDNDPMMYSYFLITYHIAAPAYCEVLDWLVGKKIYIDIDSTAKGKWYCYMWEGGSAIDATCQYFTREESYNAAIVKVLEELI